MIKADRKFIQVGIGANRKTLDVLVIERHKKRSQSIARRMKAQGKNKFRIAETLGVKYWNVEFLTTEPSIWLPKYQEVMKREGQQNVG